MAYIEIWPTVVVAADKAVTWYWWGSDAKDGKA